MGVSLGTLDLTPEERAHFEGLIRAKAFQLWNDAGRPEGSGNEFWLQAERQWIESEYVPRRHFDGRRPADAQTPVNGDVHGAGPSITIDGRPIDPEVAAKRS